MLDQIESARRKVDDNLGDMSEETEFVSAVQDIAADDMPDFDDTDGFDSDDTDDLMATISTSELATTAR
jgi:hypothetical protein